MNRRRYLRLGAASASVLAGCTNQSATPSGTEGAATQNTVYVAPDGDDEDSGTEEAPLATIQAAMRMAKPGWTVSVSPGHYFENVRTVRAGAPGDPITVTGPAEAVLHGKKDGSFAAGFIARHSHVHLTGLTLDGTLNPEKPEEPRSYANLNYFTPYQREDYLQNLVVKPHAVGNVRRAAVKFAKVNDVEVGEFEVIGPAGIDYLHGDEEGHNGEIVYIGSAPNNMGGSEGGIPGTIDESQDYHVHHIDNSEGHEHAELVDVKAGASDVLIEYCTDGGGAGAYLLEGHDETSETAIHLGGRNCTLRWSVIENSHGQAVEVGSWGAAHPERFEENTGIPFPEQGFESGQENSIYGNRLLDNGGLAIQYPLVYPDDGEPKIAEPYGPDDQAAICGNDVSGRTHGTPTGSCTAEIPDGDREPLGSHGRLAGQPRTGGREAIGSIEGR
jgi:hypothetical protein